MTTHNSKIIGMVGLGNMGSALAESVLAKDFPVNVWNRTQSKTEHLKALGSTVSSSVEEAALQSDILVVCLLDHTAIKNSLMSPEVGAALRGKSLVQVTTTTKDEVDELIEWTDNYDIQLLKGGIMVYPDDIRAGNGAILYGGSKNLFDQLHPLLIAMGGKPTHVCETPADVVAAISASYSFLYSALISYLYGTAICHRGGISVESFTQDIIAPFISSGSLMNYLENAGQAAARRNYNGALQATLNVWDDALLQTITDIEAIDIDTAILTPLKSLLETSSANGYGESDIAAVIETLLSKKE